MSEFRQVRPKLELFRCADGQAAVEIKVKLTDAAHWEVVQNAWSKPVWIMDGPAKGKRVSLDWNRPRIFLQEFTRSVDGDGPFGAEETITPGDVSVYYAIGKTILAEEAYTIPNRRRVKSLRVKSEITVRFAEGEDRIP